MQGLHHHQQQLAALLSSALPKDNDSTHSSEDDGNDSTRLSALNSLHRAILFPHNSLLLAHSSNFLSQGFSQLLADKSYAVRRSAAIGYGALCAVVSTSGLSDRFVAWVLPLLRDGTGAVDLALHALREFVNVGDANAIERHVLPILKACQELLEDERTSLSLLHQLLSVLGVISGKFARLFQPHFVDIIDLLLGWALVPDLPEVDRCGIMDSFLQFSKHWLSNLQFSLGLLSKFLGDMDVLLKDGNQGTPDQFRRLLALLSCFLTVLQVTATEMLAINVLDQLNEHLIRMVPQLLACLSLVGKKFGWSSRIAELWRCLTLLAEILSEKFAAFYPLAFDILFQSLSKENDVVHVGTSKVTSIQIHGILKTNLQLLSLQKFGILPSAARKILQFSSHISQLRLHPNHIVTGSCAATYLFLLQHGNDEVVEQSISALREELEFLKSMLGGSQYSEKELRSTKERKPYSQLEISALIKFDLKVLLGSISLGPGNGSLLCRPDVAAIYKERSLKLGSFILEKLNPFECPIQDYGEVQVNVVKTLSKLNEVEFLSKYSITKKLCKRAPIGVDTEKLLGRNDLRSKVSIAVIECLEKYSPCLVKSLHASSPLSIKLEALHWVYNFCLSVITVNEDESLVNKSLEESTSINFGDALITALLDAASDREMKVRCYVASVIEILLQGKLLYPGHLYAVTGVVLEKLGDPDTSTKNAFLRVFSLVFPVTMYACGLFDYEVNIACRPDILRSGDKSYLHWKQLFALKQLPQKLNSQQLVTILSYISQKWKAPLSSWIQRLIHSFHVVQNFASLPLDEAQKHDSDGLWMDIKIEDTMLDKICSVDNLAAVWWSIHEAARYCVSVRLRTNLGGPSQTFAALERMLLDLSHILHLESQQNDVNINMGLSGTHLLPMRLLLDFVEALKKNVYNAYDGSSVLPFPPRQSSIFFRANKKVCEEWFSRICEPMLNAGMTLQCQAATFQYCSLRLQELRNLVMTTSKDKSRIQIMENFRSKYSGDILRVLRHAALALCRSREPEALIGLEKWTTLTFSSFLTEDNQIKGPLKILGSISWITGLVYQAQGQYERAAAQFSHLLQTEEELSLLGSDGVQFVIDRVIDCYTALSDWKSLESWLLELQSLRSKHAGKNYSGALTAAGNEINAVHALARFDDGDCRAAWAYLDLTPKTSNTLTLDPKLALQRSEQMLLQAMLFQGDGNVDKVPLELEKAKSMLEEVLSVLPLDGLTEAASYATQLHCISAFEECSKFGDRQEPPKQLQTILNSYNQVMLSPMNRINQDCNLWIKVFRVYRTVLPTSPMTLQLCQRLTTLARKQGNLMLAHRLSIYLKEHLSSCSGETYHSFLSGHLEYESILLMHAENKVEEAVTSLWSFICPYMLSSAVIHLNTAESFLKAKACLKFSSWLRKEHRGTCLESTVLKILEGFKTSNESSISRHGHSVSIGNENSKPSFGLLVEEIVGTTTKLSSILCPSMGKTWLSYASWCYSQAKHSISARHDLVLQSSSLSSLLHHEVFPNINQLTNEEIARVETIILKLLKNSRDSEHVNGSDKVVGDENPIPVNDLVHQVVRLIEAAGGAPGVEDSAGESLSAVLASQLEMCLLCTKHGLMRKDIISSVNELVNVWWLLRQRRVALFGHAAHGFMQYLSYASSKLPEGHLPSSDLYSLKQKTESNNLRAMLYVLNILLNYGVELKDTLEAGLSSVPLLPWQEITPQLFAQLSSHPEQDVRKQLEGLLMRLARQSPCSIVYPTLVDINSYELEPSEELQHILGCLGKLYPRLVQDVQLMINQLGNVTVLWEELWLSTLQDLHSDVVRRINVLKEEATRIAENATLSHGEKNKINATKYSAMMAPIVVALERRLVSTSRKPETPHEIWFQEEYAEQLKSAIVAFKSPPISASALGDVWRSFDTIAASLATCQRKSSISLSDVAPRLGMLSSSDVPMPGLEKQNTAAESAGIPSTDLQKTVTIASFSEQVTILSTKTKPKKLAILGSDGQTYTYLLKGREDLRLDARIMQLLQAINGFLRQSCSTRKQSLAIRYYSVTPISGRAGLIQWVDNVVSIYSVYKSWQNRVQLMQLSGMGTGTTNSTVPPPVPRPSDMFYGKIIPALKEKGIRRVISRRDWPHDVKRKVLLDLMKETPRQLLHQEIWCASEGFKAFGSKLKRYSGSIATMSIVGHVLGLGDRHLDNVLLDFCSGDVVHIDYNVCFDKGRRLKIPEIVPFRLTQTIEAALGLTGVEGTFRANCEAVVGALRKNKDIVLMLLDVFVWDPLVEWTRGDGHDEATIGGEERKGMELAVSLSLFASRVQEIRVPLQEHHDLLLVTLPAVEFALERFFDVLNHYEVVSAVFFQADKERSNLALNESSAKSIVAEATSNSEKICASFEVQSREFAQAKADAVLKAQEAAMWIEQHGRVLDALRSGSIPEMHAFLKLSGMREALSLTSAVVVAGVPLTIVPEPTQAKCHDLDSEVSQLITDLEGGLSCAGEALQAYSLALQRVLPLNYIISSPVHGWAQLLQLTVNTLSSDVLSLARRQASDLMAKTQGDGHNSVQKRHGDLCHIAEKYVTEIEKVEEECSELVNSIGSDAEAKAKDRLRSAFTKYMQSAGFSKKEESFGSLGASRDFRLQRELEEKKEKVLSVLHVAASALYNEVKCKVLDILSEPTDRVGWIHPENDSHNSVATFSGFEEQIEKCILVAGYINDLRQFIGIDVSSATKDIGNVNYSSDENWASIFKAGLISCRILIEQMTQVVLPELIRAVVSNNSEIMDAFGSLSQIRGSIDSTLEQLVEAEVEKASLVELEQNYSVQVGLITEQKLALEEASVKGRDHLSWEEAEELATQEEACRAQLDQLHQTWNQKDLRTSSLMKRESDVRNTLVSSENYFLSLISADQGRNPHIMKNQALLAKLAGPFSELQSVDRLLSSAGAHAASYSNGSSNIVDMMTSGYSLSESVLKFSTLLDKHSFFIWKIGIMYFIIDSCIHDISSSMDHNLGFDQLYNVLKKKLEKQLQDHIAKYLRERIAPALLWKLEKESEHLKQLTVTTKEVGYDLVKRESAAVKRVQVMLEEYCNAHETARAARSAASLMNRQMTELKEALHKTMLEIVQIEWLHDVSLPYLQNNRVISQKFLVSDDDVYPTLLNLNRCKLLDNIQSAMSAIGRSVEYLQSCERSSVPAEGQLERAMGWACAGPTPSSNGSVKSSGIPPEFHEHLERRRQLLWAVREQASDTVKICSAVMEFEASRDGIFQTPAEVAAGRNPGDGKTWQQTYSNALTMLDVTYHSFTRAEQECKLAQSSMEAAANSLFSASNELGIASATAKSASGDLQSTLAAMRDFAREASVALSSFTRVSRSHTAMTSECGSMLEEVLAITEGLHDVHSLGKEAAAVHSALMTDLSKANAVLLPLYSVLSKDVTAMTDTISGDRESKMDIPPIHGQAIYQSYCSRIREALTSLKPMVPSLSVSVKELHSMLTMLARTASLHAGNLHKALEGLGESQEVSSQKITLSSTDLENDDDLFDKEGDLLPETNTDSNVDLPNAEGLSLEDEEWISLPDSIYDSSSVSDNSSFETSQCDDGDADEPSIGEQFQQDPKNLNNQESSLHVHSEFVDAASNTATPASDLTSDHLEDTSSDVDALLPSGEKSENLEYESIVGTEIVDEEKDGSGKHGSPAAVDCGRRVKRGKNAYAMMVLRRVEMKLDGRDIDSNREISVSDQVDYLLKQATSVDNLCNMYEGWTPWI
ncbi:non-specific serine/threonine protein kinase [Ranunculus cassubicifolius]